MANYFVDPVNGNDSTGSGSVSAPWATIGKAIGSTPAITMSGTGDTVWLIPSGLHRQRNVVIALTPGVGNVLTIQGDFDGAAQRASGSSTVITGPCIWTAFTTSDTTWPTDTNGVLSLNGKTYITIQFIEFIGGRNTTATCITGTTAGLTNITVKSCVFNSWSSASGPSINFTFSANPSPTPNIVVDSCIFLGPSGVYVFLTQSTTSQYSIGSIIQNCLFICSSGYHIYITSSGSGTYNGYGLTVQNCTFFGGPGTAAINSSFSSGTSVSTNYMASIYNCIFFVSATTAMKCSDSTHSFIYEDYNIVYGTLEVNSTSGGHSKSVSGANAFAPNVHFGEQLLWGANDRPFAMPWANSPMLGFGSGGSPTSYDWTQKPRPAGGGSLTGASGYLDRQNTGAQNASIVQGSSPDSIQIAGPGTQELMVAVNNATTNISLYMYADTNYGTTNPPSAILLANGECGVAIQTLVMSPTTTGQWNQMSFSAFTPTQAGVVTIRLVSNPAAANGNAYFDTFTLA